MKNNFKLLALLFTTILCFTSCDKDLYEDIELQKQSIEAIDVKTITYEEFKRKLKPLEKKPLVKMIIDDTNSISNYARTGDDSEIEIFTDVIKEITSGTYKSYTMYIKTSDTIASKFYNLTLEEKEGNTAAFITKYSPTENWLNDKNQPFQGEITTFRVEPGPGGSIKFTHIDDGGGGGSSYPFDCDGYVQTSILLEPYQCGCGPEHWPWQTCGCTTSHPPGYTPHYYYECIPNNFGTPETSYPGSGYSPGGGGSSTTQPNDPSNNSLTTIVGEPIIRPAVAYLANLLSLNGRQVTFLTNNPVIEGQISNYISENTDSNNVVNPEAMAFALEAINSLEEGGEVNFDFQLILDPSFTNEPCLKGVYDKMIQNSQTANNYLNNFDSTMSVANLKFAGDSMLSSTTNAETSPPQNYLITITFNTNNLNRPELSIARTFIHELIHAEIFRKLLSISNHPSINLTLTQLYQNKENFPGLYDYYSRFILNSEQLSEPQHQMMAQHYREIISNALKEFDNNQHPQDVYDSLAWAGLMGEGTINMQTGLTSNPTVAWQNLSQTQRLNILNTIETFESNNTNCQ